MILVLALTTSHLFSNMKTYTIATKSPVTISSYNNNSFLIHTTHIQDTYETIKAKVPELAIKVCMIVDDSTTKLFVDITVSITIEYCVTEDGLYTHIKLTY